VAAHFYLSPSPWTAGSSFENVEGMHLAAEDGRIAYFQSLRTVVDTADLDQLDPYGDRSWSPTEATAMAERLQALYDALHGDAADRAAPSRLRKGGLWPNGAFGDWEPSDEAGGRAGVSDFLFWLRRTFLEAAQRQMYVLALGD
jgi:hypothetical protein